VPALRATEIAIVFIATVPGHHVRGCQSSERPTPRSRLSNALPFSGLGAAKPARRFYADASAATRSAATACSTASHRHFDFFALTASRSPACLATLASDARKP